MREYCLIALPVTVIHRYCCGLGVRQINKRQVAHADRQADFCAVTVVNHAEHTVLRDDLADTDTFATHASVKRCANLRPLLQPFSVFQTFFRGGQFSAHFGQLRYALIERTGITLSQLRPFIARLYGLCFFTGE